MSEHLEQLTRPGEQAHPGAWVRLDRPFERRADVLVVLPSLVQKGSCDERRPTGIRLLRDSQVVMEVTLPGALELAARHQQLVRVLADGFE